MNARRGSSGTGTPTLVAFTRVDHARPVHPANVFAFEASLIWVAYHFGIRLFDGVDAYARRLLGEYVLSEREARLMRIAAVYPAAAAEAWLAGRR